MAIAAQKDSLVKLSIVLNPDNRTYSLKDPEVGSPWLVGTPEEVSSIKKDLERKGVLPCDFHHHNRARFPSSD